MPVISWCICVVEYHGAVHSDGKFVIERSAFNKS